MRATGTFSVLSFVPAQVTPPPLAVATGVPVGLSTMEKQYDGEVTGRSATLFTAAFDHAQGVGTYLAMESFDGSLNGIAGTFNFAHSATTHGSDRVAEHFTIVPGSATGGLTGIAGGGGIGIDDDGRHSIWFDYDLGT
jgi:hypothetical protein